MVKILAYSPRVREEVTRFFREHPTVEIRVRREADMGTPCVRLSGAVCEACGFHWRPDRVFEDTLHGGLRALGEETPRGSLPSDFLGAIELTHAWDKSSRSRYCGGRMTLQAGPVEALAATGG